MAPLEITTTIAMSFRHDGQVALELGDARRRVLDRRVADVLDVRATMMIVRDWALDRRLAPHRDLQLSPEPWDHEGTYPITLAARPTADLHRFTSRADGLCRSFRAAFARERSADRSTAAGFADELAHEMKNFVLGCRRAAVARAAGGRYADVLETYLQEMSAVRAKQDQTYYRDSISSGVGPILLAEQYLLLSEDEHLRDLYVALQREATALYQWYTDLARSGYRREW